MTTSAFGTSAAASACHSERKPSTAGGDAELLREVRERRDADAAADEQRPLDVEPEAVAERAEDVDRLARLEGASACVPGPIGSMQEGELTGRREAEAHRPRQQPAGRLEHEELPRDPRLEPAALDLEERVRPDRVDSQRPLAAVSSASMRSWRDSASSVRALAIACTAAAAPEIVVMHGTRATSAASRIR